MKKQIQQKQNTTKDHIYENIDFYVILNSAFKKLRILNIDEKFVDELYLYFKKHFHPKIQSLLDKAINFYIKRLFSRITRLKMYESDGYKIKVFKPKVIEIKTDLIKFSVKISSSGKDFNLVGFIDDKGDLYLSDSIGGDDILWEITYKKINTKSKVFGTNDFFDMMNHLDMFSGLDTSMTIKNNAHLCYNNLYYSIRKFMDSKGYFHHGDFYKTEDVKKDISNHFMTTILIDELLKFYQPQADIIAYISNLRETIYRNKTKYIGLNKYVTWLRNTFAAFDVFQIYMDLVKALKELNNFIEVNKESLHKHSDYDMLMKFKSSKLTDYGYCEFVEFISNFLGTDSENDKVVIWIFSIDKFVKSVMSNEDFS